MLRSPCPKCREPMRVGLKCCPHCSYRLMRYESRRALQIAGLKLVTTCLTAGVLIVAVHYS